MSYVSKTFAGTLEFCLLTEAGRYALQAPMINCLLSIARQRASSLLF